MLTVKQWRLAKGLSQESMAKKCGVHRNTYAAWEENPDSISVGNAKTIAEALGESVNLIFFAKNSTKPREENEDSTKTSYCVSCTCDRNEKEGD